MWTLNLVGHSTLDLGFSAYGYYLCFRIDIRYSVYILCMTHTDVLRFGFRVYEYISALRYMNMYDTLHSSPTTVYEPHGCTLY